MPPFPGYLQKLPLVFVDTETGGLDPVRCALLSVAATRTDPDGLHIVSTPLDAKVRPFGGLLVESQAAAVNGYTPEKWEGAEPEPFVLAKLKDLLAGCVWVGHSPHFDRDFLNAAYGRYPSPPYKLGYRYLIDTAVLAWPFVKKMNLRDMKLQTVAAALGIAVAPGDAHTAGSDVETCRQVYLRCMESYR